MWFSKHLQRATQRRISTRTWSDEQFLEARERDLSERTASVWSVVAAALASLTLVALLTTAKLVEIAQRQPLGGWRDRQLVVARGADRAANSLSLNRPYDLILEIRGAGNSAGQVIDTIDEATPVSTTTVAIGGAITPGTAPVATTTTTEPYLLRTVDPSGSMLSFASRPSSRAPTTSTGRPSWLPSSPVPTPRPWFCSWVPTIFRT